MNDIAFGDLRSLMQSNTFDSCWRFEACALLEDAYERWGEVYASEWVPYLEGFEGAWSVPLRRTWGEEDLARWRSIAPFATFDHVDWTKLIDGVIAALHEHPRVEVLLCERAEPVGDGEIDEVHEKLGWAFDPRFVSFFRACNGLRLVWITQDAEREETETSNIFWNRSYATELPCGCLNIPSFAELLDLPFEFDGYSSPGAYAHETLGGWDDSILRRCMRHIDDFEQVIKEGDYSYHMPALVLHPRFPDPPVLMTSDAAADVSSSRPMLARDYLLFVLATLGQEDVRMEFISKRSTRGNALFVSPHDWFTTAPEPAQILDVLFEQSNETVRERLSKFTDNTGESTEQTPFARYALPLELDPFVVVEDPLEGLESIAWEEVTFVNHTTFSAQVALLEELIGGEVDLHELTRHTPRLPSHPFERYVARDVLDRGELTSKAMESFVGRAVKFKERDGQWEMGFALMLRGDALICLIRSRSEDAWALEPYEASELSSLGAAIMHRLEVYGPEDEETWHVRELFIPPG